MNVKPQWMAPAALLLIGMCACKGGEDKRSAGPGGSASAAPVKTDDRAAAGGEQTATAGPRTIPIVNARTFEGNLVGGEITSEQIREAAAQGYKTIVSLRTEQEGHLEEHRALAEQQGMTYVHIPIAGSEDLTRENADVLDRALSSGSPAVVHCASGNRVGALFGLRAFWFKGATAEQAMAVAREVGVTGLAGEVQKIMSASP